MTLGIPEKRVLRPRREGGGKALLTEEGEVSSYISGK